MSANPTAVDSLDAAWAEAEAVLPDGWRLTGVTYEPYEAALSGGGLVTYDRWRAEAAGVLRRQIGEAHSPAAALRMLATVLRRVGA